MQASVIIPTWNRKDALLETLNALAVSDLPANEWETIVVDDGSQDDTEAAVLRWIEQSGTPVRFLKQVNSGPAAARNNGARAARGDVLIFMDNDILVKPDFIRRHIETLSANPGCWVVGRIVHPPQLRVTPFGRYRDDLWESFHHSHSGSATMETDGITAANLSLPVADFHRLGGFDEDFTIASSEDCELGIRARQAGIKVLYNPAIITMHNDWAVSLTKFCERQRLYSISDVLFWQKYGDASPRVNLVVENSPILFTKDPLKLVAKKMFKSLLATNAGRWALETLATIGERLAPDTKLCLAIYKALIAVSIFRGVREGLKRYSIDCRAVRAASKASRAQDQTA